MYFLRLCLNLLFSLVETIQKLLKSRVASLMKEFVDKSEEEIAEGTKVYHDAVLYEMNKDARDAFEGTTRKAEFRLKLRGTLYNHFCFSF